MKFYVRVKYYEVNLVYESGADFSKLSRRERRNLQWSKLEREFRKRVKLVLAEKKINTVRFNFSILFFFFLFCE